MKLKLDTLKSADSDANEYILTVESNGRKYYGAFIVEEKHQDNPKVVMRELEFCAKRLSKALTKAWT